MPDPTWYLSVDNDDCTLDGVPNAPGDRWCSLWGPRGPCNPYVEGPYYQWLAIAEAIEQGITRRFKRVAFAPALAQGGSLHSPHNSTGERDHVHLTTAELDGLVRSIRDQLAPAPGSRPPGVPTAAPVTPALAPTPPRASAIPDDLATLLDEQADSCKGVQTASWMHFGKAACDPALVERRNDAIDAVNAWVIGRRRLRAHPSPPAPVEAPAPVAVGLLSREELRALWERESLGAWTLRPGSGLSMNIMRAVERRVLTRHRAPVEATREATAATVPPRNAAASFYLDIPKAMDGSLPSFLVNPLDADRLSVFDTGELYATIHGTAHAGDIAWRLNALPIFARELAVATAARDVAEKALAEHDVRVMLEKRKVPACTPPPLTVSPPGPLSDEELWRAVGVNPDIADPGDGHQSTWRVSASLDDLRAVAAAARAPLEREVARLKAELSAVANIVEGREDEVGPLPAVERAVAELNRYREASAARVTPLPGPHGDGTDTLIAHEPNCAATKLTLQQFGRPIDMGELTPGTPLTHIAMSRALGEVIGPPYNGREVTDAMMVALGPVALPGVDRARDLLIDYLARRNADNPDNPTFDDCAPGPRERAVEDMRRALATLPRADADTVWRKDGPRDTDDEVATIGPFTLRVGKMGGEWRYTVRLDGHLVGNGDVGSLDGAKRGAVRVAAGWMNKCSAAPTERAAWEAEARRCAACGMPGAQNDINRLPWCGGEECGRLATMAAEILGKKTHPGSAWLVLSPSPAPEDGVVTP